MLEIAKSGSQMTQILKEKEYPAGTLILFKNKDSSRIITGILLLTSATFSKPKFEYTLKSINLVKWFTFDKQTSYYNMDKYLQVTTDPIYMSEILCEVFLP